MDLFCQWGFGLVFRGFVSMGGKATDNVFTEKKEDKGFFPSILC